MWQCERQKGEILLQIGKETCSERERNLVFKNGGFLVRECATSFKDYGQSDRRISSGREAKLFYASRTTRGHRFRGVSTNSMR